MINNNRRYTWTYRHLISWPLLLLLNGTTVACEEDGCERVLRVGSLYIEDRLPFEDVVFVEDEPTEVVFHTYGGGCDSFGETRFVNVTSGPLEGAVSLTPYDYTVEGNCVCAHALKTFEHRKTFAFTESGWNTLILSVSPRRSAEPESHIVFRFWVLPNEG